MSFFSPESSNSGSTAFDLIPAGTLAKAIFVVRDIKTGQSSGARYLDCELVIQGGQYDNRRIFTVICDPWDENTGEKAREMGIGAITRLMEQTGVFKPENAASYAALDNATIQDVAVRMQGKHVAFAVGIQKGKDGYGDKNTVKDWASPNPGSNGHKIHEAIMSGASSLGTKATPAPASSAFGAPKSRIKTFPDLTGAPITDATLTNPASNTPAWLKK
jgi:hypothetical protein